MNSRIDDSEIRYVGDGTLAENFDVELFDPDDPEPLPRTIVHEGQLDNVESPLVNFDDRVKTAEDYKRYVKISKVELDRGDTMVEGLQVATLWGTSDPFTYDLINDFWADKADWILPLPNNPVVYSWIELALLADGTKLVRVPDASVYPSHRGYLAETASQTQGEKMASSGLEVLTNPGASSTDGEYEIAIRESGNDVFEVFQGNFEEGADVAPYHTPATVYLNSYRRSYTGRTARGADNFVELPLMVYGKGPDGTALSRSEVLNLLETSSRGWHPLTPFWASIERGLAPSQPMPGLGAAAGVAALGTVALWRALRSTGTSDSAGTD